MLTRVFIAAFFMVFVNSFSFVSTSGADTGAPKVAKPFPTPFKVIAHRGASAYAPENTIPSYDKALELGAVDVELDIQLSKDNVVILYHDGTLQTKTGHPGKVRDYDADDLLQMDIGSWFDLTHPEVEEKFAGKTLDTLSALLEKYGNRFRYHIELKSEDEDLVKYALADIRKHDVEESVRLTSFAFEQLKRARLVAPHIPTGLLVRDATRLREDAGAAVDAPFLDLQKFWIDQCVAEGCDQVAFASEDLRPELVAYAIAAGLEIRAWRIKSDEDMHRAIQLGTAGMTTNWPDRVIRELLEHKRTPAPH